VAASATDMQRMAVADSMPAGTGMEKSVKNTSHPNESMGSPQPQCVCPWEEQEPYPPQLAPPQGISHPQGIHTPAGCWISPDIDSAWAGAEAPCTSVTATRKASSMTSGVTMSAMTCGQVLACTPAVGEDTATSSASNVGRVAGRIRLPGAERCADVVGGLFQSPMRMVSGVASPFRCGEIGHRVCHCGEVGDGQWSARGWPV
jgi:hypothetical protein